MAAESELKMEIAPQTSAEFIEFMAANGWKPNSSLMLANCYYDTPNQDLQRGRIALRVRRAGNQWIQTLKTAGSVEANGITTRGEWEWELPNSELNTNVALEYLPEDIDVAALRPLFTTDFKRTTWLVDYKGASIEVALDQGEIFAAPRRVPISEVELELKTGDKGGLLALAEVLQASIKLQVSTVSKAQRAQQLLDGDFVYGS